MASWDGSPDQTGELLYYSTASQVENRLESPQSIGNIEFLLQSQDLKSMDAPGWLHSIRNYHSGTDSTETWASPPAQVPGVSKSWGMNIGNIELMKCNIKVGGQNILTSSNSGQQSTVSCIVSEVVQGTLPLAGTFVMSFDTRYTSTVLIQGVYNTSAIAHDAVATRAESGGAGTSMGRDSGGTTKYR